MLEIEQIIIFDENNPLLSLKPGPYRFKPKNFFELYIYSCSKALVALNNHIDKSKLSLSMIDPNYLNVGDVNGESTGAQIELLVENSIIRVQSIYDRALILVNKILNIGLSNEAISHSSIITNDHVKIWSIDKPLKKLNKACTEYRHIRNTVIHHDRFSEDELNNLVLIIDSHKLLIASGKESPFDERLIRSITNDYLEVKKGDLEAYLKAIVQHVHSLYDTLIPIYKFHRKQIMQGI